MAQTGQIPRRQFGKTGVQLSALGLGGHHLGDAEDLNTAKLMLKQNLEIAANFKPMTESEMSELRKRCSVDAADGHLELFKTTVKYDGDSGREQHGYPT